MPDYDAIIDQVASEPAEVSVDGMTVKNHKLSELIDARDRDAGDDAPIEQPHRGLRFTKIRAPKSAGL